MILPVVSHHLPIWVMPQEGVMSCVLQKASILFPQNFLNCTSFKFLLEMEDGTRVSSLLNFFSDQKTGIDSFYQLVYMHVEGTKISLFVNRWRIYPGYA